MPRTAISAAIGCSFILAVLPAATQNKETVARFAKEVHVGPVEQGLVGVTVTFHGKGGEAIETRHGNGMVLRCDGFVLFPSGLLAHRRDEPDEIRPDIRIDLRLDATPVRSAAPWPVHIPQNVPLRMVKLANVHTPALRTLLPDVLQPGDALTVAWRPWDAEKRSFGPLQKKTVHYNGRSPGRNKQAYFQVQEPIDGVPMGAVVLGPEGLTVGMAPENGSRAATEFISMEALGSVTNCVIPVPTPDSLFLASQGEAAPQNETPAAAFGDVGSEQTGAKRTTGGMVRIAGGPVALIRSVLNRQDEMQSASVACLPPFEIDRTEVTNGQYWDWWSRLPAKKPADVVFQAACRPLGWAGEGAPFPDDIKDVPVLGVPFQAARAYARAQGKRLPTPYEWCLAALGPGGEGQAPAWMAQYVEDRKAAALRIKEAHLQFLREHIAEVDAEGFIHPAQSAQIIPPIRARNGTGLQGIPDPRIHSAHFWGYLPWLIHPERELLTGPLAVQGPVALFRLNERLEMQAFSKDAVDTEINTIWSRYKSPMRVLPGGSREFDVSPVGVPDMLFNAHEYVIAPPFAEHSEAGFTLYVNWVGMSSKELAEDFLVLTGPVNSAGYWHSSRVMRMPPSPRLARWMEVGMNFHEARSLFYLIAGWSFEMGTEPLHELHEVRDAFPWHGVIPIAQGEFPAWLHPVWRGKSSREVKEIGSAVDIHRLATLPADEGALGYAFLNIDVLRPIGFRCAR